MSDYALALRSSLDLATSLSAAGVAPARESGQFVAQGIIEDIIRTIGDLRDAIISAIADRLAGWGSFLTNTLTTIQTAIHAALAGIGDAIRGIGAVLSAVIESMLAGLATALGGALTALRDRMAELLAGLTATVGGVLTALRDRIAELLAGVGAILRGALEGVGSAMRQALETVGAVVRGALADIQRALQDALAGVGATVRGALTELSETVARIQQWVAANVIGPATRAAQQLREMIDAAARWVRQSLAGMLTKALDFLAWLDELRPYLDNGDFIGLGRKLESDLKQSLLGPVYTALRAIIYISALTAFEISLSFVPAQYRAQKAAIAGAGLENVDVGTAAMAVRLGAADRETLHRIAARQGIPADQADLALATTQSIIPPGTIQEASLRGLLDDGAARDRLARHGYSAADIDALMALRWSVPPPTDLIRFAVREVFNPELAEKLSLYEEYPEQFSKYAEQIGISDEWARRYWAAHWDLPSPTQGYEMLHRGLITESELADLLKALDYAPVWRDKLMAISYNPLTRVDIRRMYKLGVLDEQQVYRAYLDIGYNEHNAQLLTEFTKRYSAPEDEDESEQMRRASRDLYLRAYRRGLLGRQDAETLLLAMRYHPDDVGLMLSIADAQAADERIVVDTQDVARDTARLALRSHDDYLLSDDELRSVLTRTGSPEHVADERVALASVQREYDVRAAIADRIHDLYVGRMISETEAVSYLSASEYGDGEIAGLLRRWDVDRVIRTRRPERSELVSFFRRGIITAQQLADELRGLGYHERYIRWYMQSLGVGNEDITSSVD